MRRVPIWILIAALASACTPASSEPVAVAVPTSTTSSSTTTTLPPSTTTTVPATTTTSVRSCRLAPVADARIPVADPSELALTLSTMTRPECADVVVVASPEDAAAVTGARVAAEEQAPLLLTGIGEQRLRQELLRLRPRRVVTIGADIERVPEAQMLQVGIDTEPVVPPGSGTGLILVDNRHRSLTPVATAFASQTGAQVREVPKDIRRVGPELRALIQSAPSISLVGGFGDAASWQLDTVRAGIELPGGGQVLFPGRRLVALYGSPYASGLGVLGEQPVGESIDLAKALAAEYQALDGTPTIAAFDLIATVASAGEGDDGDYSHELSLDELRPWVQAAGDAGVYVVLDLQPGRTDFLTQAKRYEELLLLPHVGLALDPEWRLGPDQVHLRQIGSVDGAEVNDVIEWLSSLVRDHRLPQKLLMVHQFKFSMISDRDVIRTPPELAVVIQMDGQGPLGTKYDTYDAITAQTEGTGWRWGWKNFYDEDTPTATPAQTLDVEPQPVFVSYQ